MSNTLTIALSKGRILGETLPLLEKANIVPAEDIHKSRKLIFDTNHEHIKLVILRATDVPTYVEHGIADFGVSGKDVLMEANTKNLYELLDLKISKCRLMTAGVVGQALPNRRLKVASKFSKTAKAYFAEQGIDLVYNSEKQNNWLFNEVWDSGEHYQKYLQFRTEDGTLDAIASMCEDAPSIRIFDIIPT